MSEATEENGGGRGPEGTIPDNDQGVGLTADENRSGFEPEEDPEAVDGPDGGEAALGHS